MNIGSEGEEGIVWNLSPTGWRLSGSLPLQLGDVCSLTMMLPTNNPLSVTAGIVQWVRGEECRVMGRSKSGSAMGVAKGQTWQWYCDH